MLSFLQTLLDYPFVVQTIKYIADTTQFVWLGHTSNYTGDEIRTVWSTSENNYFDNSEDTLKVKLDLPDYAPFSLKHISHLICYYLQTYFSISLLKQKDYTIISKWSYSVPTIFSDRIVVYYSRRAQWCAYIDSETQWKETQDTLMDWIDEHKGKESEDATWTIISILDKETMNDLTNVLFPFMSPSGTFIHTSYVRKIYPKTLRLETIDGDDIEI